MEVFKSFIHLITCKQNYDHISITILRVLVATSVTMLLGCVIGIIPKYSIQANYFINTVIYPTFQSIPPMVWVLLFAIWFGLAQASPIILLSLVALPYVIIPISQGMKELDESLIELGLSFTRKKIKIFKYIVFPLLYPYFFTALKSSFGFIGRFVVVAEIFTAINGIGYMMSISRELYDVSGLLAWTIVIGVFIAFFEYGIFNYIEKKTLRKSKHN
jgi:NitT/TauT family transport system permease protein